MDEELKELLAKAESKLDAITAKADVAKSENDKLKSELKTLRSEIAQTKDVDAQTVLELKNELADLELKMGNLAPSNGGMTTKEMLDAHALSIKTAFARHLKGKVSEKLSDLGVDVEYGKSESHALELTVKSLNLTNTGEGLESVDQVLSREIIERARESYPIIASVRRRNMPRKLREEVLISYPSVQEGLENVAGSSISETDTQKYAEVENRVAKINAKPRITDEAMYGSDLGLYEHLLTLLDDEIGRRLATQILFGNGTGKNMRGILTSNRLDITDVTGESWKPTIDASDPRDPDFYPAFGTGVSGGLPATDAEIIDWLIDLVTMLPTKYLNSAKFTLNRRTLARFKKVRDLQGRPIFMESYMGSRASLMGYDVTLEDYTPDIGAADAPFMIFGDLMQAFSISEGDIDKTLIDPYTVDGCTVVKKDIEYFEMVGKNDAIIIGVATTNDDQA